MVVFPIPMATVTKGLLPVPFGYTSLYWQPNAQAAWIKLGQISLSFIGTINYLTNTVEYDVTDVVLGASDPWGIITNLKLNHQTYPNQHTLLIRSIKLI